MAEYALAVVHGRPCFHINMVMDISPNCDCHGENDAPILPNIGMFASFDPIALDQACADACQKAQPLPNSQMADHLAEKTGTATTTISWTAIPEWTGPPPWNTGKRSGWGPEPMN